MTDEQGLLQAILESPGDDLPRLVYADWLDENGDPDRAEFIRTQVELARMGKGDERRASLALREQALLDRHQKAWLAALPGDAPPNYKFRPRFVAVVRIAAAPFLSHAEPNGR